VTTCAGTSTSSLAPPSNIMGATTILGVPSPSGC
jgi:hypothetical protein